ncbi:MAG: helix-turn-helix domain-containing protein [Cellvibrio sp.]|uniref:helix-turn-helix domain-containing protein n=1 Tax=Cellvibrio sp. TaxID=1965322 RepID=UPI0031A134A3
MSFFAILTEARFTPYEVILFWIASYTVIYIHLAGILRFPTISVVPQFTCSLPAVDKPVSIHENNNSASDTNFEYLKISVDEKIRSEQLYARPHLNIERMAQLLELPARQLSLLIRQEFQQNYFEFINHYRLMAAKERLVSKEWDESSVQDIYESVGFSSRSTFFTLFKKREGITPAEYRCKYRSNQQLE